MLFLLNDFQQFSMVGFHWMKDMRTRATGPECDPKCLSGFIGNIVHCLPATHTILVATVLTVKLIHAGPTHPTQRRVNEGAGEEGDPKDRVLEQQKKAPGEGGHRCVGWSVVDWVDCCRADRKKFTVHKVRDTQTKPSGPPSQWVIAMCACVLCCVVSVCLFLCTVVLL